VKILFHNNQLDVRGTTVAITDYARYNQEVLGNESIICYDASLRHGGYRGEDPGVLDRLSKEFKVIPHQGVEDIQKIIDIEQIDYAYFLRSGNVDYLPNNCKTGVHAVFQNYQPHGNQYAYVSEWLADKMAKSNGLTSMPWVPHIVNLPSPTGNFRTELGIQPGQFVIGRHGGRYSFDIPFVKQAIYDLLNQRNDIVFVFAGTEPWIDHPNVKFLNDIQDLQSKSNLINTWDAMLHARSDGESFGLAICEALYLNKPVLAWENGNDLHHTMILENFETLYSQENIFEKLMNIRDLVGKEDWYKRVLQFAPDQVMKKFDQVFLRVT
jgi:glycosyltransferase involved in cell wall biosynthesis